MIVVIAGIVLLAGAAFAAGRLTAPKPEARPLHGDVHVTGDLGERVRTHSATAAASFRRRLEQGR